MRCARPCGAGAIIPDGSTELKAGDEVVVITDRKSLPDLQETWGQPGG